MISTVSLKNIERGTQEMNKTGISGTAQYLTFVLAEERYAVDVAKVREVLELSSITRVPRTPEFMRGVINLRGSVVPVIDLRMKFGMSGTEKTVNTCIVVMEIDLEGEVLVLGALADSVQEVIEIEAGQIEPAPRIGTRLNTDFIHGMAKRDESFLIILNIDRVFTSEDMNAVLVEKAEEPEHEEIEST